MRIQNFLVPLVFVALIFFALRSEKNFLLGKGDFAVKELSPGVIQLTWRDTIEAPMALRLESHYAEWRGSTRRFVIDLSSSGGSLTEGGKVIDVIRKMQRNHRIDTRVGKGRRCLSMCVPIFLQGQTREAAANSRWMFHQPISVDIKGEVVDQRTFERNYVGNKFFDKYFVPSPMAPEWREALRQEWVGKDIWRTGQDLVDERSNIINDLR